MRAADLPYPIAPREQISMKWVVVQQIHLSGTFRDRMLKVVEHLCQACSWQWIE